MSAEAAAAEAQAWEWVALPTADGGTVPVRKLGTLYRGKADRAMVWPIYAIDALKWAAAELRLRQRQDDDAVVFISGDEGVGKSTLAAHLVWTLGRERAHLCFSGEEVLEAMDRAQKGDIIWYDEALEGLNSRDAMMRLHKHLMEILSRARIRRHIYIICIPAMQILDWLIARRGFLWFHCKRRGGLQKGVAYVWKQKGTILRRRKGGKVVDVWWVPCFVLRFPQFPPARGMPEEEKGVMAEWWKEYVRRKEESISARLREIRAGEKAPSGKAGKIIKHLAREGITCPDCGGRIYIDPEKVMKGAKGAEGGEI